MCTEQSGQTHTRWKGKKEPDSSETEITLLRQTPRPHVLLQIHTKTPNHHRHLRYLPPSSARQFISVSQTLRYPFGRTTGAASRCYLCHGSGDSRRGGCTAGRWGWGGCRVCKALVVVPASCGTGSSSLITTIFSSSSSSTGLISTLPRARLAKKVTQVLKCHLEDQVAKEILASVNPQGHLSSGTPASLTALQSIKTHGKNNKRS